MYICVSLYVTKIENTTPIIKNQNMSYIDQRPWSCDLLLLQRYINPVCVLYSEPNWCSCIFLSLTKASVGGGGGGGGGGPGIFSPCLLYS